MQIVMKKGMVQNRIYVYTKVEVILKYVSIEIERIKSFRHNDEQKVCILCVHIWNIVNISLIM